MSLRACLPQAGAARISALPSPLETSTSRIVNLPPTSNPLCRSFPDRMVFPLVLTCVHVQDNKHDTRTKQSFASHHAVRCRALLARDTCPRSPRGRHVRPRRALHAHLLPPLVPRAPAAAPQRHFLPHARRSRASGLPPLPALPPQRSLRPGRARSACRRPPRAIHRRNPEPPPTRANSQRNAIHVTSRFSPSHRS